MFSFIQLLAQAKKSGGGSASQSIGGTFECIGGYCPDLTDETATSAVDQFNLFSTNLLGFATTIAGLMFLLYFALGGLAWITAGGDASKIEKAQKQMTNGAIGLVVVVAAYAIAWIVGSVVGLDILNPSNTIEQIGPQV